VDKQGAHDGHDQAHLLEDLSGHGVAVALARLNAAAR
jgi:hypothetical protein